MKKIILLSFAALILFIQKSYSQIKLPKNFECVLGENHGNESYFTDGNYSFTSYPWGHEGLIGQEVIEAIEDGWGHKVKFQHTKDDLYWATGKVGNDDYVYCIIVNDALQFTLHSKTNNSQFSNYSTWLLQQIRNNIKSDLEVYFTDYLGKNCFGIRN